MAIGACSAIAIALLYLCPSGIIIKDALVVEPVPSSVTSFITPDHLVRLRIPAIGVNAPVLPVGVEEGGEMGAPESPETLGWFDEGPRPGEVGSAVIDGHFGWRGGVPAVFDHLSELVPGDRIYFDDGEGEIVSFLVTRLKSYGEHDDASEVFVSTDGRSHLNLITCQGAWDKARKSYSGRLVVFADRE
jgi:LPXTG-site transpeptidase (sortase) family protein